MFMLVFGTSQPRLLLLRLMWISGDLAWRLFKR